MKKRVAQNKQVLFMMGNNFLKYRLRLSRLKSVNRANKSQLLQLAGSIYPPVVSHILHCSVANFDKLRYQILDFILKYLRVARSKYE